MYRTCFALCGFFISLLPLLPYGHVPEYLSTPSNKIEQYCMLAEDCVHDTIPICGKMEDEKRTFLDTCDLLEYACDTNMIFTHIDDIPGCPVFRAP